MWPRYGPRLLSDFINADRVTCMLHTSPGCMDEDSLVDSGTLGTSQDASIGAANNPDNAGSGVRKSNLLNIEILPQEEALIQDDTIYSEDAKNRSHCKTLSQHSWSRHSVMATARCSSAIRQRQGHTKSSYPCTKVCSNK